MLPRCVWNRPELGALLLLLGASVSVGSCSSNCTCELPEMPATAATEIERRQQDLDYLVLGLTRCHKNLFFALSTASFEERAAQLRARLTDLSADEMILRLAELVASVGDAHTNMLMALASRFRMYAVNLFWFEEGLFVTNVDSSQAQSLGRRVVRIGDVNVEEARSRVSACISHENDPWVLALSPRHLAMAEVLHGYDLSADANEARYTLESDDGTLSELTLAPLEHGTQPAWAEADEAVRPLYRQHPERNYWFTFLSDSGTLYFQYNQCQDEPGRSFARVTSEMLETLESSSVERLVIDLRWNSGGNSDVFAPLLGALREHPEINRRGKLFVILGRHTMSSGVLNAIQLQEQTAAIFVGEPTGGKPNTYGEVCTFALPNSRLPVSYSSKYFHLVEGDPPSLVPEVRVRITASDYFSGVDPALEATLSYGAGS
jgi:hypothetical protein